MLHTILEAAGLSAERCADLLGINHRVFAEWAAAQRPIPTSYVYLLSDILGVNPSVLQMTPKQVRTRGIQDVIPAIWYKFRGEGLSDADREYVLLIRQLGHFQNEIEEVTGRRAVAWKPLFDAIRKEVDTQAPPAEQGRQAALMLRESTGLSQCATGIGEVLRGNLRRSGMLVVENPIPESRIEGCSFYVGAHPMERPCIFANSHHSTWFRRNVVLMHELGHAIFDAPSAAASLDFFEEVDQPEISEQRAQAFAQEALIPREVLRHVAQSHGMKWDALSRRDVGILIAETHVEQRMLAKAAVDAGLLDPQLGQEVNSWEVWEELRKISDRALTTEEYLEKLAEADKERLLFGKRTTTIPARAIRLPVPYILNVVEALRENRISKGKAAQLLLIEKQDLESRFGDLIPAAEDE